MSEDVEEYKVPTQEEIDRDRFYAEINRQSYLLEAYNLKVLPDDYWPEEWRKSIRHILILAKVLIADMSDKAKVDEYSKRVTKAFSTAMDVMKELESEKYNPDRTKRR